jgi:hypothetical protein
MSNLNNSASQPATASKSVEMNDSASDSGPVPPCESASGPYFSLELDRKYPGNYGVWRVESEPGTSTDGDTSCPTTEWPIYTRWSAQAPRYTAAYSQANTPIEKRFYNGVRLPDKLYAPIRPSGLSSRPWIIRPHPANCSRCTQVPDDIIKQEFITNVSTNQVFSQVNNKNSESTSSTPRPTGLLPPPTTSESVALASISTMSASAASSINYSIGPSREVDLYAVKQVYGLNSSNKEESHMNTFDAARLRRLRPSAKTAALPSESTMSSSAATSRRRANYPKLEVVTPAKTLRRSHSPRARSTSPALSFRRQDSWSDSE